MYARALINLIKDRVSCAKCMYKLHWRIREILCLQVAHHFAASQSHKHLRVHSICVLWRSNFFQSTLELIDTLQALYCRIHIAGVTKVLEASWYNDSRLFIHGTGSLLRGHVFKELNRLSWFSKTLILRCAHQHHRHAILDAERG